MKNKASLLLMELLVMIPVFALAAAICLQVFSAAQRTSLQTQRTEAAMGIAQNAAELLKAGSEPETVEKRLADAEFSVRIQEIPEELGGLNKARITVSDDGKELICLTVGYREVQP